MYGLENHYSIQLHGKDLSPGIDPYTKSRRAVDQAGQNYLA